MSALLRLTILTTVVMSLAATAHAQNVLIIWDDNGADTTSLATALSGAGMSVTLSDTDETLYDGTNPPLVGFDVVIHLNGTTYSTEMDTDGQDALVSFVQIGGGYIHGEWSAYEFGNNRMQNMSDLILFDRSGGATTVVTYNDVQGQEGHDILAGVPSTLSFDCGHNKGFVRAFGQDEPEVLMNHADGYHGVAVREWGYGRIVGFSHAGNYSNLGVLANANVQQLFINAAAWASNTACQDVDGDGYDDQACGGTDCDDYDANTYPGAAPDDSPLACMTDADGDDYGDDSPDYGVLAGTDCDDNDALINPGIAENDCDYLDNDCDGALHPFEVDNDGDSYDECSQDCDDADADTYPGAAYAEGIFCMTDADGDGYGSDSPAAGVLPGTDCDDAAAAVNPGEAEAPCDHLDTNCDGSYDAQEVDDDVDGQDECGGDCDDANAAVYTGATEVACDYYDNDCDGALHPQEVDDDGDSFDECQGDPNDNDPTVYPNATELACDYLDNDGDGQLHPDEVDDDGDGYDECSGECDDADPQIHPGASETACDYVDNDCDGVLHTDEVDGDGDSYDECQGDCNDTDAAVNPGASEVSCD